MVYMDASQLGWRPLTLSWLTTLPATLSDAARSHILGLFDWLVPAALRFARREIKFAAPVDAGTLVTALQRLFSACAAHLADTDAAQSLGEHGIVLHAEAAFLFALVWSIGAAAGAAEGRAAFDGFLRAAVANKLSGALFAARLCRLWCRKGCRHWQHWYIDAINVV